MCSPWWAYRHACEENRLSAARPSPPSLLLHVMPDYEGLPMCPGGGLSSLPRCKCHVRLHLHKMLHLQREWTPYYPASPLMLCMLTCIGRGRAAQSGCIGSAQLAFDGYSRMGPSCCAEEQLCNPTRCRQRLAMQRPASTFTLSMAPLVEPSLFCTTVCSRYRSPRDCSVFL